MSFSINDCVPLVKPFNGCDFHRLDMPLRALRFNKPSSGSLEEDVKECKLVLFNREPALSMNMLDDMERLCKLRDLYGFKIVMDMDDYHRLHEGHIVYQGWEKSGYGKNLEEIMKKADAVTCTTERLAMKLREFNPNVFVIPNAVAFTADGSQWDYPKDKVFGGLPTKKLMKNGSVKMIPAHTRFGWSGGASHMKDMMSIAPVFREFPYLDFKLCGYDRRGTQKGMNTVYDEMEKIINLKSKNQNFRKAATKPLEEYMTHLNDIDVAIAPLEHIEWNGYKSSLKAYEAGVKRCAFICSNIPPYTDDIPEECATFCETNEEWMDAIEDHMDLEYVRHQADKLSLWVGRERNLIVVSDYRLKVYDHISSGGKALVFPSFEYLIRNYQPQQEKQTA